MDSVPENLKELLPNQVEEPKDADYQKKEEKNE